jgi:hypothetical protein
MLTNSNGLIVWVYAGELSGNKPWRPEVKESLASVGIIQDYYQDILDSDPLADPKGQYAKTGVLDPKRYVFANYMYEYRAPLGPDDTVNAQGRTISTNASTTTGSGAVDTHQVALDLSGSAGFLSIAKITFKDSSKWTWTNQSNTSTSSAKHGLLGTSDSLPERTWINLRREPAPTRITTGLGTHQTHGRSRLAPKQARDLNPVVTSQLTLCRSSSIAATHRIMSVSSRLNSIRIWGYCENAFSRTSLTNSATPGSLLSLGRATLSVEISLSATKSLKV